MDDDKRANIPTGTTRLGGKSWVAYMPAALVCSALLFLATPRALSISELAGIFVLAASLAYASYKFLLLKSFQLYFDDAGVWLYSGILPWTKGVIGVKWRDLDEAVYFQSLSSWLFKSYSIRIGHRFTKSSEILLSHWERGNEAVMAINEQHQKLVRAGTLH